MMPTHLELLRRLAINDEQALSRLMDGRAVDALVLDDKTSALVNVATLRGNGSQQSVLPMGR